MDIPIKPISIVPKVTPAEIPETRVDRNLPREPQGLRLASGVFRFAKGQIVLNGQNVGVLLEAAVDQPAAFWSALARDLHAFLNQHLGTQSLRRPLRKRRRKTGEIDKEVGGAEELSVLAALVEAYIAKIMRILKRKYDEKTDGLSFTLDPDGQLVVNGVNVNSFIQMAQQYPSSKATLFLKGLKNRLSLILSNKTGSSNYEKIREVTLHLFSDIDRELKRIVEKDRLIENT